MAALEVLHQETGKSSLVEAKMFVVCAGGIESPKILLRSNNHGWTKGVGNDFGALGKYFFTHPILDFSAKGQKNPRKLNKELDFVTAVSRHFDSPATQRNGKFCLQNWGSGYDLGDMMEKGMTPKLILGQIETAELCGMSALLEEVPSEKNSISLGSRKDRFGLPESVINYHWEPETRKRIDHAKGICKGILSKMGYTDIACKELPAAHPMGTCRVGQSPEVGVVDRNLWVHGTDNLYICSTAVFPSAGAVNPTLTLAALALKLGRHLDGEK